MKKTLLRVIAPFAIAAGIGLAVAGTANAECYTYVGTSFGPGRTLVYHYENNAGYDIYTRHYQGEFIQT